jgi:hypothetical protein
MTIIVVVIMMIIIIIVIAGFSRMYKYHHYHSDVYKKFFPSIIESPISCVALAMKHLFHNPMTWTIATWTCCQPQRKIWLRVVLKMCRIIMSVVSGLVRHNFSKTLDGHVVSVFIDFKSCVLLYSIIYYRVIDSLKNQKRVSSRYIRSIQNLWVFAGLYNSKGRFCQICLAAYSPTNITYIYIIIYVYI